MKEVRKRKRMYDVAGGRYEEARYGDRYKGLYRKMRNEMLVEIIGRHFTGEAGIQILEIGCGTGMTLEYLSTLNAGYELYGLDFSRTMLSQSNEKLKNPSNNFWLTQGDSYELPFGGATFDVVYSTRFIHQFSHEEKKKIFEEMRRVLKPQGLIVTEFYTRHGRVSRYLRGLKEIPKPNQCPTISEVEDVAGSQISVRTVRMMGLRAIDNLLGIPVLKRLTSLTNKPLLRLLAEEYFIVSGK